MRRDGRRRARRRPRLGRGLPPGRAVAVAEDDPDTLVYAARNRLYVSRDGGIFWNALEVELPEIEAVALRG